MSKTLSFDDLPRVIIKYILSSLSIEDLMNLELSSKRIYKLIKEKEIWKDHYLGLEENERELSKVNGKVNWKEKFGKLMKLRAEQFKEIVISFHGVIVSGKSSSIQRYVTGNYVEDIDKYLEEAYYKDLRFRGLKVKLTIIDTVATEGYSAMRELWMSDSQALVYFYSIVDEESFRGLDYLYEFASSAKKLIDFLQQLWVDLLR